jgi:hypothetical protein
MNMKKELYKKKKVSKYEIRNFSAKKTSKERIEELFLLLLGVCYFLVFMAAIFIFFPYKTHNNVPMTKQEVEGIYNFLNIILITGILLSITYWLWGVFALKIAPNSARIWNIIVFSLFFGVILLLKGIGFQGLGFPL